MMGVAPHPPRLEPADDAADARSRVQADPHLELEILLGLDSLQLEQGAEGVLDHGHRVVLSGLVKG